MQLRVRVPQVYRQKYWVKRIERTCTPKLKMFLALHPGITEKEALDLQERWLNGDPNPIGWSAADSRNFKQWVHDRNVFWSIHFSPIAGVIEIENKARMAQLVFRLLLPTGMCDALFADLRERCSLIERRSGSKEARHWYWSELRRSVARVLWALLKRVSGLEAIRRRIGR